VSGDFFAHSRLGVATFGAYVWDSTQAFHRCLMTRVIDKSSSFLVACYMEILLGGGIDINNYEVIHFWSDGPGQYKSREVFATSTFEIWKACSKEKLKSIQWSFFCPKHGKGVVDSMFGTNSKQLEVAYQHHEHRTVRDMVVSMRKYAADAHVQHPDADRMYYDEWLPKPKGTYPRRLFTLQSLDGITSSYSFGVNFTDSRRTGLQGRGANFAKCTGILLTNRGQCGQASIASHPDLDFDFKLTPAELLAEAPPPEELEITTTMSGGWRTSFMEDQTNKHTRRLAHLAKNLAALKDPVVESRRHRSFAHVQGKYYEGAKAKTGRKKESMKYHKGMHDLLGE
jgi:hypothetical protein